jgi:hypothetical protein
MLILDVTFFTCLSLTAEVNATTTISIVIHNIAIMDITVFCGVV